MQKDNKIEEYETIMLNGFCLLEPVKIPPSSELDLIDHGYYQDRGIVRYLGQPNKKYVNPTYHDNTELKIGDLAFIQTGYNPFFLERKAYFALWEIGKQFFCVQRRRLIFSI